MSRGTNEIGWVELLSGRRLNLATDCVRIAIIARRPSKQIEVPGLSNRYPTEVDFLLGDSSKARAKLGWRHRTSFDTLVSDMVKADMAAVLAERERRNRHA